MAVSLGKMTVEVDVVPVWSGRSYLALDQATKNRLADVFLEHARTPRSKLFEYPHRDDDSRTMIRNAELAASKFMQVLAEST